MNYDAWKTTNPADASLSQEEVDERELERLYQDNERLRAELKQVQDAWYGRCVIIEERDKEIERLQRENTRLRWLMTVAQAVR